MSLQFPKRSWNQVLAFAASFAVSCTAVQAQDASTYPSKPIRMVMSQPPGNAPDILARILSDHVSKSLGQPVIIEYKPSAGGVIALDAAAKAAPDGYTVVFAGPSALTVAPYIKKKLPYDPFTDFLALTIVGQSANVLVVGPSLKVDTMAQLVQHIKSNPGKVQFGSAGIGSPAHLAGELLNALTGAQMLHIPYKGATQALNDVVAGTVDLMITSPASAKAFISGGRLKALASTGQRPDPALPDVPLLSDTVPQYEITQWWGLVLRAGTPEPIVRKLHAAFVAALKDPRVQSQFQLQGVVPRMTTPAEFEAFLKLERVRHQDLIKRANIPMED